MHSISFHSISSSSSSISLLKHFELLPNALHTNRAFLEMLCALIAARKVPARLKHCVFVQTSTHHTQLFVFVFLRNCALYALQRSYQFAFQLHQPRHIELRHVDSAQLIQPRLVRSTIAALHSPINILFAFFVDQTVAVRVTTLCARIVCAVALSRLPSLGLHLLRRHHLIVRAQSIIR